MSEIFLKIINMSISASYIVLAVLLLRSLLKKAPKWITVVLWGIVAVRLICPFSIESVLSLIPSAETISPQVLVEPTEINTGFAVINNTVNPIIQESAVTVSPEKSINVLQLFVLIFSKVWGIGLVAMLIYTAISYLNLKRKIGTAVLLRDNIYQSENVVSPFVLGIIKPRIYLPFNMSEKNMEHVVAHEMAHIRRKDHLSKPLGFLLLTLHWFNPLMWLGYVLLCRDIELACDEKVIKELDHDARADYSQALLTCSVNRRMIAACPLAFGEVGVKDRVKSVLNYKKPAFWIIIAAVVACVVVAVCFLTNPIDTKKALDDDLKVYIDCQIAGRFQSDESEGRACCLDWEVLGKKQSGSTTTLYMWVLYKEYSYNGRELKNETGAHIPTVITVKKEDGQYKLIEYWQAKDGSYHVPSIKEKFPWYLHRKALDSQRYVKEQSEKCLQLALDYFGLITAPELNSGIVDLDSLTYDQRQLIDKYPEYFGLDASGGLDVYVWLMAPNNYYFGLLPHAETGRDWISSELLNLRGVRAEDMSVILSTYNIDEDDIYIIPWQHPLSSYLGEWQIIREGETVEDLDTKKQDYVESIRQMLFSSSAPMEFNTMVYDTATFDIDNDGVNEICSLRHGYTSGVFTFVFTVQDTAVSATEYQTVFYSQWYDLSFQKDSDGVTRVQGITQGENPETHLFDISIEDGYINLTENGVPIGLVLNLGEAVHTYAKKAELVYASPVYSFVMDPLRVPEVSINDGVIYTMSASDQERLGAAKEISITTRNFDDLIVVFDGFDHPDLLRKLRKNNKAAYEVIPDVSVNGIEIYYVMEQKSGETLIVYGHYENGEKENEIRFIYSITP